MRTTTKGLTAQQLKWVAIVAMTCDHLAYALLPGDNPFNVILRLFGKFTFPIMCFFIAEGYYHTHNLARYATRLGVFALLSHTPFVFFHNWINGATHQWGVFTLLPTSVIFTLLCGLLALAAWERITDKALRLALVAVLCLLPMLLQADWCDGGVLVVLAFGIFRGDKKKQLAAFFCAGIALFGPPVFAAAAGLMDWVVLIQCLGFFLAFPLLQRYNGQRGGGSKWLFYIYYPVHQVVIYAAVFPLLWPFVAHLWA